MNGDGVLAAFWQAARQARPGLPVDIPPAWAFGATSEEADTLAALVLEGRKCATSSAWSDYAEVGEELPAEGDLSILLDRSGHPRAVLKVTRVTVLPFFEVSETHAAAEGEGDRSLAGWRAEHERFWREHSAGGFPPDMLVVCEEFRVFHR